MGLPIHLQHSIPDLTDRAFVFFLFGAAADLFLIHRLLLLQKGRLTGFMVLHLSHRQVDLDRPAPLFEFQILLGLLAVFTQAVDPALDLKNDIVHPVQVPGGIGELSLRIILPAPVADDAGGFLEDRSPAFSPVVDDIRDLPLTDDGIAFHAHAGIHDQLPHILQTAGISVDLVFTFSGSDHPAGDRHLVVFDGQYVFMVIDDKCYFRNATSLPALCPCENNLLHFPAPQLLRALFPQHPADGVGDIAFPAAVGTNDAGDAVHEFHTYRFCEGFEPVHVQSLKIQCFRPHSLTRVSPPVVRLLSCFCRYPGPALFRPPPGRW